MRVLLLPPTCHGMWQAYAHGFTDAGHNVDVARYDDRSAPLDAATATATAWGHRLRHGTIPYEVLWQRYTAKAQRHTAKARRGVDGGNYDLVVVIRGTLINAEVFAEARARGARIIVWLDCDLSELVFYNAPRLKQYDAVATFSRHDADELRRDGVDAHHIPYGFNSRYVPTAARITGDVVFVGARDDYREHTLEAMQARGMPVKAHGRRWSRGPVARAKSLTWRRPAVRGAPAVAYDDAKRLYQTSLAALNLHARGQTLINPRTFDIAGVGGLQLTDRADTAEYYDPGIEVLVFGGVEEAYDLVRRAQRDPVWAHRIRTAARRRTLAEHTMARRCADVAALV